MPDIMEDIHEYPYWYAVHTRSRHEKKVSQLLKAKVAECFLPLLEVQSRRRDREAFYSKALIPGYLFIHDTLVPELHIEVLKTPGVVKVLTARGGSDTRPCPIPDEQIESLRILLASRAKVTPFTGLQVGERVEVVSGPFMGAVGELIRLAPNRNRLVVSIQIVNHSVAVDIDVGDIRKID